MNVTAAGDAFKKAAELHLGMDTKHEAASNFTEAAQVMKRDEPKGKREEERKREIGSCSCYSICAEAVDCYLKAVEIYTDMVSV